jgi:hypothetical protein
VLTATQQQRLAKAWTSDTPVFIVAPDEVMKPAARPAGTAPLTWKFHAENVRDFAWVSSKTYVWDAMGFKYRPTDKTIELHSLYPRDAMPLWGLRQHKAIAQTMKTYGRMSFEYPYPKAVNVQRTDRRHGVPDDLLQRPASGARRHLHGAHQVRTHLRRHP